MPTVSAPAGTDRPLFAAPDTDAGAAGPVPEGVGEFETPAPDPAERVARLTQLKDRLERSRGFRDAMLFCLNARFAWEGVFRSWRTTAKARRDETLRAFVASMKSGRMLLSTVLPATADENRKLPHYMRSCTARWRWGLLLLETDDVDRVTTEMGTFVAHELSVSEEP